MTSVKDRDWFEDFETGEVSVSPGRTITEVDILGFAGLTGDFHPLHTDVTYAENTPFGQRIAHGLLVLSIGSALAFRLGEHHALPRSFIAFYGIDNLRFTAPVMIGDTIRLESTVTEMKAKDEARGVVTSQNRILNQRDEPVCVYTTKILCGRRPARAARSA
jgi:3-hydroxybutyryl-CoA dehydratase